MDTRVATPGDRPPDRPRDARRGDAGLAAGIASAGAVFALAGTATAVVLLGEASSAWQSALAGILLTTAVALSSVAAWMRHRVSERRIRHLKELTVHQAAEAARLEAERAYLEAEHRRLTSGQEALADEETLLRSRVHDVFVNLSMRSLTLVERQLDLIERLEHGEDDPQRLQDLFRLDHLATRMRRNSENLLVLADADGHHGRRPAIPLLDVVRAGVSEIERYERIDVGHIPRADVAGHASDDVGHLLAELMENAAAYSAPESRVEVGGWTLENGEIVLSVDDNGIGVPADRLTELNDAIERDTAGEEAASGGGLGVFVVGRLARRHGIRVQLRPRPQGGLSAVVAIPAGVFRGDGPSAAEFSAERDREQERERDRMTMPGVAPAARAIPPGAARMALPASRSAPTHSTPAQAKPTHSPTPSASTPAEGVRALETPGRGPVVPPADAGPARTTPKGLPKRTPAAPPGSVPGAPPARPAKDTDTPPPFSLPAALLPPPTGAPVPPPTGPALPSGAGGPVPPAAAPSAAPVEPAAGAPVEAAGADAAGVPGEPAAAAAPAVMPGTSEPGTPEPTGAAGSARPGPRTAETGAAPAAEPPSPPRDVRPPSAGPETSRVGRTKRGLPKRLVSSGDTGGFAVPPVQVSAAASTPVPAAIPAPVTSATDAPDPSRHTGPVSAEELRRRLTGFQTGVQAARREALPEPDADPTLEAVFPPPARDETGGERP